MDEGPSFGVYYLLLMVFLDDILVEISFKGFGSRFLCVSILLMMSNYRKTCCGCTIFLGNNID